MSPKRQINHTIRKHFNEVIYNVSRYTEIALSCYSGSDRAVWFPADPGSCRYLSDSHGHGIFYQLSLPGIVSSSRS